MCVYVPAGNAELCIVSFSYIHKYIHTYIHTLHYMTVYTIHIYSVHYTHTYMYVHIHTYIHAEAMDKKLDEWEVTRMLSEKFDRCTYAYLTHERMYVYMNKGSTSLHMHI